MDKRIYDALKYLEINPEETEASKHIKELISVCKDYVSMINDLEDDNQRLETELMVSR